MPPAVPPELLTCPASPAVPDPDTATDKDVARYIADLYRAHAECFRKLNRVGGLLAPVPPPER